MGAKCLFAVLAVKGWRRILSGRLRAAHRCGGSIPYLLVPILLGGLLWAQFYGGEARVVLPVKSASERKALQKAGVADGYCALGAEDSCLYYFKGGRWYRLCGECDPPPAPVRIDSLSSVFSDLLVHWSGEPLRPGEKVQMLLLPDSLLIEGETPVLYTALPHGGYYSVLLRRKGECGFSPWYRKDSVRVSYKACPPALWGERSIEVVGVGGACWATVDWEGPNTLAALRGKDGTLYFSSRRLAQIKAALPEGWRLPTIAEAEKLLSAINFVPERLSRFAPSKKGAYAPATKEWIGVGTASVYLLDTPDYALVINPLGGMVAPLEGKEVYARIRLLRQ